MFDSFFRLATIIILIAQFNVYSQDVEVENKSSDNISEPVEYFSTLFSEQLEKKDSKKIKLPGIYREFSPDYETTLILFEKVFNISNDNITYSLVLENRFIDQAMVKINNQFINNKIIRRDHNRKLGYEVNIPKELIKRGANKITWYI